MAAAAAAAAAGASGAAAALPGVGWGARGGVGLGAKPMSAMDRRLCVCGSRVAVMSLWQDNVVVYSGEPHHGAKYGPVSYTCTAQNARLSRFVFKQMRPAAHLELDRPAVFPAKELRMPPCPDSAAVRYFSLSSSATASCFSRDAQRSLRRLQTRTCECGMWLAHIADA